MYGIKLLYRRIRIIRNKTINMKLKYNILLVARFIRANKQEIVSKLLNSVYYSIAVFLAMNPLLVGFSHYGIESAFVIQSFGMYGLLKY